MGFGQDLLGQPGARHRQTVARQEMRGAQLVTSEAHHRGRGHRQVRADLAKACRHAR